MGLSHATVAAAVTATGTKQSNNQLKAAAEVAATSNDGGGGSDGSCGDSGGGSGGAGEGREPCICKCCTITLDTHHMTSYHTKKTKTRN